MEIKYWHLQVVGIIFLFFNQIIHRNDPIGAITMAVLGIIGVIFLGAGIIMAWKHITFNIF